MPCHWGFIPGGKINLMTVNRSRNFGHKAECPSGIRDDVSVNLSKKKKKNGRIDTCSSVYKSKRPLREID